MIQFTLVIGSLLFKNLLFLEVLKLLISIQQQKYTNIARINIEFAIITSIDTTRTVDAS